MHILDTEARIIEVSDHWLDLLGYVREEVIGRPIDDFQEDGGAETRSILPAVLAATAEIRDVPRRFIRRDGVVLDVIASARLEYGTDGRPACLITALVDVTARKRAEAALMESERNFRLLVEGVSDHAIYMLDPEGRVTNWNSGAQRIKGYTAPEIVGRHISCLYPEEDRVAGAPERTLAMAAREGRYEDEGWRVRKDGSRFWASVVIHSIRGQDGTLIGFAKVTRDITEQRDARRALEAAREQLAHAQKMEAVGQLTGGVAHDFNNVLQAVTGNLELIQRRVGKERLDVARLASNALEAASKATALTSQLLTFARRQRLDPQPLDPVEVVEGMRALLARTLGERIALSVVAEGNIEPCFADRNQLESALLNLAINARDAITGSTGTGTVTLLIGTEHVGATPEGWPPEGDYIRIAVRDDGPGMPDGVRRHAFEPFFTTKAPGKGTGLGLAQIHDFAHQSGGTARIESAPGHGTEVAILLPKSREPAPVKTEPFTSSSEVEAGFGETVLVVEDDPMVRRALAETLRDLRYRVAEAADADAALAMLDRGLAPDVVLSDVMMPGSMDGAELATEVCKRFPKLPVILATGNVGPLAERWLASGGLLLRKPHSRAGIAAALRRALTETQEPVGA